MKTPPPSTTDNKVSTVKNVKILRKRSENISRNDKFNTTVARAESENTLVDVVLCRNI